MRPIEMMKKVQRTYQVIDHSGYFYLLIVVIDYLSELCLQLIDLLIIAQFDLMGGRNHLFSIFASHPL